MLMVILSAFPIGDDTSRCHIARPGSTPVFWSFTLHGTFSRGAGIYPHHSEGSHSFSAYWDFTTQELGHC